MSGRRPIGAPASNQRCADLSVLAARALSASYGNQRRITGRSCPRRARQMTDHQAGLPALSRFPAELGTGLPDILLCGWCVRDRCPASVLRGIVTSYCLTAARTDGVP